MSSTLWLLKIRNRTNPKLSLIAVLNLSKRLSQDFFRHCWYLTRFDNDFSLKFASFTLPFWWVLIFAIDDVIHQFIDQVNKHHPSIKTAEISEAKKYVFRLVTSVGQRKILSRHEESNLRPSDLRSDALPLSHNDSSVTGVYYEVLMTRVLHTARISNVDSVMFFW